MTNDAADDLWNARFAYVEPMVDALADRYERVMRSVEPPPYTPGTSGPKDVPDARARLEWFRMVSAYWIRKNHDGSLADGDDTMWHMAELCAYSNVAALLDRLLDRPEPQEALDLWGAMS